MKEEQGYTRWPEEVTSRPGDELALCQCICPVFQEFWPGLAWRSLEREVSHRIPFHTGRWSGAGCLYTVPMSAFSVCIHCLHSLRCDYFLQVCRKLGFLYPSDAPRLLLLGCSYCLMNSKLVKRTLELFLLSFLRLLTRFYILFLCIRCLARTPLFAWMLPWNASQSAALSRGTGRQAPLCSVCGRLMVALELESAGLFEELAEKSASGPSLQKVQIRAQENAF